MSILVELHHIEDDFVASVRDEKANGSALLSRAKRFLDGLHGPHLTALSVEEVTALRKTFQRIRSVASGIEKFATISSTLVGDTSKRLRKALTNQGTDAFSDLSQGKEQPRQPMATAPSIPEEELTRPYRLWFLDNFAWPYPESSERLRLLAQVPSHGRAQLSNWFVNSRRRSGWSRLAKTYTDGDRDAFAAFLRKIDNGNATEEEAEDVEKCKAHFMDKGNMLVRDGIEEVLTAASKGVLTDGCVPPPKTARSRIFPIKIEDPGNPVLSKKRGRIGDVEDPPSSPCSKRSASGSWTDSSGVLSNDTAETSADSTSDVATPRRKSARVPRSPAAKSLRPTTKPAPSTPAHRAPFTPSRLPHTPHLRSFSSPLSSPTSGRSTRSGLTYRAVSSSFTIEQPNLAGELALPPPPFQITSNEHFVTLAATETWSNLDPWLNFEVDLNAI
ncbi:BZ3500_MvSof-1268-A1-R1_Chr7-3g09629 [Microbotryum saponariae]|uniref:BZ3500_MvSof-1268-A1-R1_Chr7-3g09629 protein n=1 Tax=Microbotryum saponariae TaxID=289078 RepID=A0A2X0LC61_9BASI|nr:BZ3500_MvSof-1268-A1-R1_Chr7-3g09629 [Microbotryum saponariae]